LKTVYHSANSRGHANHGWLSAKHSFSFASWYDPDRIHFGALRVLNDDIVAPGMGFGTHPHDNMEIITIPLSGSIRHQDSMGNSSVITAGEVQVMSAGTGVQHSEFNPDHKNPLNLFQIWIFPNRRNVEPRYDQFRMDVERINNNFLLLVSPDPNEDGTWIHQNAWIHIAKPSAGFLLNYKMKDKNNGVYLMVVGGRVKVGDRILEQKDALGVWDTNGVTIEALEDSKVLAIEVPMVFDLN
jgi:redox-sensitive bicupin YhaK (pirin superfamily)